MTASEHKQHGNNREICNQQKQNSINPTLESRISEADMSKTLVIKKNR